MLKTNRSVVPHGEDGVDQISYYDEAVGALIAQRGLRNKALAKLDSGGAPMAVNLSSSASSPVCTPVLARI
ncbi:MAG: hypothetical protein WBN68_08530 [Sedimenticolaceae bacterium]